MFKYLIFFASANFAIRALILLMMGMTAILSLRGVMPISTILASGALRRQVSKIALMPPMVSSSLESSLPWGDLLPTLLVPASRMIILGLTLSNSPLLRRHRIFCVVSPPQTEVSSIPAKEILPPVNEEVFVLL